MNYAKILNLLNKLNGRKAYLEQDQKLEKTIFFDNKTYDNKNIIFSDEVLEDSKVTINHYKSLLATGNIKYKDYIEIFKAINILIPWQFLFEDLNLTEMARNLYLVDAEIHNIYEYNMYNSLQERLDNNLKYSDNLNEDIRQGIFY